MFVNGNVLYKVLNVNGNVLYKVLNVNVNHISERDTHPGHASDPTAQLYHTKVTCLEGTVDDNSQKYRL